MSSKLTLWDMLLSLLLVWNFDCIGRSLPGESVMPFSVAEPINDHPANY